MREALSVTPAELLGPGSSLPLGLLVGALAAGLVCVVLRAPWRDVGDALAVAASVMIPIGRVGCWLNGCCQGSPCGPWASALGVCVAHPVSGVPIHPLQFYFAAASLLTLSVLLWELRRGARPGTLLATFCIVRPAAKLALEPLRADPVAGGEGLMLGIPAAVLASTVLALVVSAIVSRQRRKERSRRAQAVAATR